MGLSHAGMASRLTESRGGAAGRPLGCAEEWSLGPGGASAAGALGGVEGQEQVGVRMRPRPCSPALLWRAAELLIRVGTTAGVRLPRRWKRRRARFAAELQRRSSSSSHVELIPLLPEAVHASIYT
jgi:hypothetical protein